MKKISRENIQGKFPFFHVMSELYVCIGNNLGLQNLRCCAHFSSVGTLLEHRRNLGGTGRWTPTFLKWDDGPPLYKYTKSEILLGLSLFRLY